MRHARTSWLLGFAVCTSVVAPLAGAGCATSDDKPKTTRRYRERVVDTSYEAKVNPNAVTPEQMEALDMFFRRKMQPLQYRCYNEEVERTGKKFEGNMTIAMVVAPGGKAGQVKVTSSSLKSESLTACVVSEVESWEWPDVASPAPFTGSMNFKPAW